MHDVVIRGGLIVDGTGTPGFVGDVAVDGSTISAVGGAAGPARRVIEADGLLVTPGWVDIHTHYDAQATWDPMLAPSCWHGVTTALFGNCGVGFAPVRRQDRESLIELMEGVEDIPGVTLTEGLKWDWESFPEFLDVLERLPRVMDIAAQVPHHPLRVFVMGERAIRREAATDDDIAKMRQLTIEALRAGAFGFTTSRTEGHKTSSGELVPGRNAEVKELFGIGSALGEVGAGTFGMLSDFEDEDAEFSWFAELSLQIGRPVWFLLSDRPYDPGRWRRLLSKVRTARAAGATVLAEVAGRPIGLLMGVDTALNPFSVRPSYQHLKSLPAAERLARLRDPAVRAEILGDAPSEDLLRATAPLVAELTRRWDRIFVMGTPPDYEPPESLSLAAIAHREGRTPDEVAYDYITQGVDRFLFFATTGYVEDNHDVIREMLVDEGTILGLGDAGAHCSTIVDASLPTFMLTHWARDRYRGLPLPLETVVKMQTSETASYFGFSDRGILAPGYKADINVIDYDRLNLHTPEIVYDLPAGGRRLIQKVDGYVATLLSGIPTFEHGHPTGAMPGKLVRAGR
jgi:N-acyl-D-amino-acid deacylase